MTCQPPNSPDCNVLDLGFFAAIQSLQQRKRSNNIDELIASVLQAFEELSLESLDNVFLSLQAVMECILNHEGGNGFKLPHLGKEALRKQGKLPETLTCAWESVEASFGAIMKLESEIESQ
jgi:hypothetical protein